MTLYRYGDWVVNQRGRIIETYASGEWNEEMAGEIMQRFIAIAESLEGQTFAALVYVGDYVLGTPEFQQKIIAGTQRLVDMGLRREAYVMFDGGMKLAQFSAMTPQLGPYQRRYFTSHIDGLAWLAEEGYSPQPEVL